MYQRGVLFQQCLRLDADERPTCSELLRHDFFTHDGFSKRFSADLKARVQRENAHNPLLRRSGSRRDPEEDAANTRKEKRRKRVSVRETTAVKNLLFQSGL